MARPKSDRHPGETVPGVRVVALQAPLSFLNAYVFQRAIQSLSGQSPPSRLLVIEANAIVEIDYTAAKILGEVVTRLRQQGIDVAFARLESVRAQESFTRLGLEALVGGDHLFHSVEEAVRALTTGPARGSGVTTPIPSAPLSVALRSCPKANVCASRVCHRQQAPRR